MKSNPSSPAAAALLVLATICALARPAAADEQRCGWLHNPTPGNWWLSDAAGTWVLATQGSETRAAGMDLIHDLTRREFVRTNGSYGHACVCLTGTFAPAEGRVLRIVAARQLPLARCRADRALPRP